MLVSSECPDLGRPTHTMPPHTREPPLPQSHSRLQFLLALTKPHKEHRRRGWWNLVHKWLGRAVVIIAIANIY